MAAPNHIPFRSGSLSTSLDEGKKRPTQNIREINYSEKQLPDIPRKQPKCYKPFATRAPFLVAIALCALAIFICVEIFAQRYQDINQVHDLPVPWPKGLTPEDFMGPPDAALGGQTSQVNSDGQPLEVGNTDIGKRSVENDGAFGTPAVTALDPKTFNPILGLLSIFRDVNKDQPHRAVFQSKYFRQLGQRGMSSRRMAKRDEQTDMTSTSEALIVEIDILSEITKDEESDGACGRRLLSGIQESCHRVKHRGRYLRHPRDLSKQALKKRQVDSSGSENSTDSSSEGRASQDDPNAGPGPTFTPEDIYGDYDSLMLTLGEYFIASYLLLLLSFFVRVLWICAYNSIRMMEPFYALASPKGATAEHALNAMYLRDSLLPEPVRAFRGRQWVMFVAGLGSLWVALLPAFALGVLRTDDTQCPYAVIPDILHPCAQTIYIQTWVLRIFETLLILIFVIAIGIAVTNHYRSSGVYSDPSAIATLTSLLHHPTMVERLCRIDDATTDEELEEIFDDDRYRIAGYRTLDMTTRYGVVPIGKTGWVSRSPTEDSISSVDKGKARFAARKLADQPRRKTWKRVIKKLLTEISLTMALVTLLAINVAYYVELDPTPFNTFFNSTDLGPRFILTMAGAWIASAWRRIECQNRTRAPYQRLRKPGPPTPLLTPTCSSAWTSFFYAIVRRQPLVVLTAFCTMLSEVLLFSLSGVPFSPTQYLTANLAHMYLTMAILGFMLLVLGIHVFVRLRNQALMPRDPDTLLGAWSYVAASEMREDFEYLALHDTETRARRVQSWGKQYQFAEQICMDGVQRLALDEVANKCVVYRA